MEASVGAARRPSAAEGAAREAASGVDAGSVASAAQRVPADVLAGLVEGRLRQQDLPRQRQPHDARGHVGGHADELLFVGLLLRQLHHLPEVNAGADRERAAGPSRRW